MPNRTISLPDEVIPIIDSLDEPFSHWVRDQLLKQHASQDDGSERWEQIEVMAQHLAGRVEWMAVEALRAGGDGVR